PATYVYCLVAAERRPGFRDVPRGLPDLGPPRLLGVSVGLWAVVADAPAGRLDAAAVERGLRDLEWVAARAAAHEAVVERWLDEAVVPLRLFTLFRDDASALEHLRARAEDVRAAAAAARGCREWTLRVLVDPARARVAARARADEAATAEATASSAGQAFLERKRRERDAQRAASADVRAEARSAVEALAARARRTFVDPAPAAAERLVAEATFLVPRAGEPGFLGEAEAACARLEAVGCEGRLSGPWPPYRAARAVAATEPAT
ncbi:MAG: GvpL/GvpF family gas vesicle protein, partial [Planctomycetes bacterium]|nr:GvpL/GvpF family gas vesicle protein [Planctomycetota bacterium]